MKAKVRKYTPDSSLRSLLKSPLGKDIVMRVLLQFGKSKALIDNPVMSFVRLKHLVKFTKGLLSEADVDNIVKLLNASLEEQYIPSPQKPETQKWWKETVVYQIYPRSFKDSDGDGVGDIDGIIEKLDYLKALGVGTVWLSPVYQSPNDDNGYDISDYRAIMKEFGTMEDFDRLLSEVHARKMHLVMDLVINHTSDEHEWFKRALNGEEKYQDYYIRRKNIDGNPPNNWRSVFSGPAWNYYKDTDDFYLHIFTKKQIDLNWENSALRQEIYDMVNFWLDKGVDGFRLDVISFISKAEGLPNGTELFDSFGYTGVEHYFAGPRLHEYLRELKSETFAKHDAFTVGETPVLGLEAIKLATAENRNELDTAFCFDHLDCPGHMRWDDYRYNLKHLKNIFDRNQQELKNGVWNTLFFDNHDNPRMISKIDRTNTYRNELTKMLALMQFTLRGTPFIYQGQELGMINVDFKDIGEFRDVESLNYFKEKTEAGMLRSDALKLLQNGSRDHARVPVQWTKDGGFTTGTPWIKMSPDTAFCNAASQIDDADSCYNFFRTVIGLRQSSPALIYGEYRKAPSSPDKYCYYRELGNERYFIEINLSQNILKRTGKGDVVLSTYGEAFDKLRPYESVIYKL